MTHTIIAEEVYKSFKKVNALNGVTVYGEKGKVLGLLGPNGAGKTTLVRILTTLMHPDSGCVEVAGVNVVENPGRVRELMGLAGQYPAVDEQLTGRENLDMVARLYHFSRRDSKERAKELLERFSLTDAADRPVKTYSGGMRRRLDLAASIVARPQVLFLDEPTTGLDPRTRIALWSFIRELVSDGATLLLTTQYLDEADALADYITLIDYGRVIAQGTSDELKTQMGSDILEIRVANPSYLTPASVALESLSKDRFTLDAETGGISIPVDKGTQRLIEAVRVLDAMGIEIADISIRRPSLDDVFLSLTGKSTSEVPAVR